MFPLFAQIVPLNRRLTPGQMESLFQHTVGGSWMASQLRSVLNFEVISKAWGNVILPRPPIYKSIKTAYQPVSCVCACYYCTNLTRIYIYIRLKCNDNYNIVPPPFAVLVMATAVQPFSDMSEWMIIVTRHGEFCIHRSL